MDGSVLLVIVALLGSCISQDQSTDSKHGVACYVQSDFRTDNLSCQGNTVIQIGAVEVAYINGDCLGTEYICPWHLIDSSMSYYEHLVSLCQGKQQCTLFSTEVRKEKYKREFPQCGDGHIQDRNSVRVEYFCKAGTSVRTSEGDNSPGVTPAGENITVMLTHSTLTDARSDLITNDLGTTFNSKATSSTSSKPQQLPSTGEVLPLTTILGIVAGTVIVLALVCLVVVLLLRRKRTTNGKKRPASVADFTYYSSTTGPQGSTLQAQHPNNNETLASTSYAFESGTKKLYYTTPVANPDADNVYAEIADTPPPLPELPPPARPSTNVYNECESCPPCPCCTEQDSSAHKAIVVDNSLYNYAWKGATSPSTDNHKLI